MKIADYELFPVETGRFGLDGGAMFGIIPKPLWSRTFPSDDRNRIEMAARALLLRGHGRTILIDTGSGAKFTAKQLDIYHYDTSVWSLEQSLLTLGISCAAITDVILTHLHFDHTGGATVRANDRYMPTFPNATYYVQKAHWDYALRPNERDHGSFRTEDFLPLQEQGVLRLLEGSEPILPHIELVISNGHTPAQQLPKISDGEQTLLYAADLIPTAAHVPLPYIMAYDLHPTITFQEKKAILATAAAENWILLYEHDPRTVASRVRVTAKGFDVGESIVVTD